MKRKIFIIALITFVIDQIIKSLSLVYLINIPIIPNILSLTYAKNYGIAFSMLKEKRIIKERFLIGKTQMEIAEEIGISQAQVSRLEKGGIKNIKKNMM